MEGEEAAEEWAAVEAEWGPEEGRMLEGLEALGLVREPEEGLGSEEEVGTSDRGGARAEPREFGRGVKMPHTGAERRRRTAATALRRIMRRHGADAWSGWPVTLKSM